jgi:hypothetical protein
VATDPIIFDLADEGDVREDIPFIVRYERSVPAGEGDGREWKKEEDTFVARGEVPAGLIMTTLASFTRGGQAGSDGVLQFLQGTLVDADSDRFMRLIRDKDVRVHMKNLAKITDWLMEQYGDRPTESA